MSQFIPTDKKDRSTRNGKAPVRLKAKSLLSGQVVLNPLVESSSVRVGLCYDRVVVCEDDPRELKRGLEDGKKYVLVVGPEACGFFARAPLESSHVRNVSAIIVADADNWSNPRSVTKFFADLVSDGVPVMVSQTHERQVQQRIQSWASPGNAFPSSSTGMNNPDCFDANVRLVFQNGEAQVLVDN